MSDTTKGPGRNDPCLCGSGRKYKQCCLDKDQQAARKTQADAAEKAANEAAKSSGEDDSAKKDSADKGAKGSVPGIQSGKAQKQPWKKVSGNPHPTQRTMPRKAGNK
jgi:hypothetical protein